MPHLFEIPPEQLPREGRGNRLQVNGHAIAIFRTPDGWHAIDDECPHRGASLSLGTLEHGRVFCPLHGWEFRLADGGCETSTQCRVQVYPVETRDGRTWISLPDSP